MLTKNQIQKLKGKSEKESGILLQVFGALGDSGRLQIFKVLLENQNVCVSDIANILGVSVPAASKQLSILEKSGLIEKVRKGQATCFKVLEENPTTKSVIKILEKVGE